MVADFFKKQKSGEYGLMIKTFAIIFVVATVLLVIANIKLFNKKKELAKEVENYSLQVKKIEESSKKLKEQIANSDNQDYIEKVAREEENMQKPGEKAVSFIMPETAKISEQNTNNILSPNFWTAGLNKLWDKIKNIF